jgi:hypothetical protein
LLSSDRLSQLQLTIRQGLIQARRIRIHISRQVLLNMPDDRHTFFLCVRIICAHERGDQGVEIDVHDLQLHATGFDFLEKRKEQQKSEQLRTLPER